MLETKEFIYRQEPEDFREASISFDNIDKDPNNYIEIVEVEQKVALLDKVAGKIQDFPLAVEFKHQVLQEEKEYTQKEKYYPKTFKGEDNTRIVGVPFFINLDNHLVEYIVFYSAKGGHAHTKRLALRSNEDFLLKFLESQQGIYTNYLDNRQSFLILANADNLQAMGVVIDGYL